MSYRSRLVIAVALSVLVGRASAQQQLKNVTVDLNTGVFTPGVPFDEEFNLTGAADLLAQSVSLEYGELTPENCRARSIPPAPPGTSVPVATCVGPASSLANPVNAADWRRNGTGAANFAFRVRPLAPNRCYGFRITQHLSPLAEEDRKKVRESLSKQFRDLLAKTFKKGTFNIDDRAEIQRKTNEAAQKAVRAQFQACLPNNALDLSADDVTKITLGILTLSTGVTDAAKNIETGRLDALELFCVGRECPSPFTPTPALIKLRKGLTALLADPRALTPGSAKAWESPVNPAREGNSNTTMVHIARALAASTDIALFELIQGKRKIVGATLEAASTPDAQSIALLDDFFALYASDAFRKKKPGGTTEPVVDPAFASQLRFNFRGLADLMRQEVQIKQELEKATLPDFLADKVLERQFDLSVMPTVITEGKNPYIGADVGIAYALGLDKAFPYFGANFYRVPVNKDATIPYRGAEAFLKRGSLLLGLTAGGVDGTKNLFPAGNVMVGVGYRFSRYVKASGGVIGFKQKDANPIVDKDHTKARPFVSMSFDVDLKQFIGSVAKLFGL